MPPPDPVRCTTNAHCPICEWSVVGVGTCCTDHFTPQRTLAGARYRFDVHAAVRASWAFEHSEFDNLLGRARHCADQSPQTTRHEVDSAGAAVSRDDAAATADDLVDLMVRSAMTRLVSGLTRDISSERASVRMASSGAVSDWIGRRSDCAGIPHRRRVEEPGPG